MKQLHKQNQKPLRAIQWEKSVPTVHRWQEGSLAVRRGRQGEGQCLRTRSGCWWTRSFIWEYWKCLNYGDGPTILRPHCRCWVVVRCKGWVLRCEKVKLLQTLVMESTTSAHQNLQTWVDGVRGVVGLIHLNVPCFGSKIPRGGYPTNATTRMRAVFAAVQDSESLGGFES